MTSSIEFPGSCSTNAYTLNDFGEVAYIVCIVATATGPSAVPEPVPLETNIARLKTAEKQFRQASILVALDIENLQLFTFYKKVDLIRDSKTLLGRVNYLVKTNNCVPSYKAAARTSDFFKPENARLYRLFLIAILNTITITSSPGHRIFRTGLRSYLVEQTDGSSPVQELLSAKEWLLYEVALQLLNAGQLVLVPARVPHLIFVPVASKDALTALNSQPVITSAIYLAPIGQIARYVGGWMGEVSNATGFSFHDLTNTSLENPVRLQAWCAALPAWLDTNTDFILEESDGVWIEVEIPVWQSSSANDSAHKDVNARAVSSLVTWRSIFWPASLCFLKRPEPHRSGHEEVEAFDSSTDPLQEISDWYSGVFTSKPTAADLASGFDSLHSDDHDHPPSDDIHSEGEPYQSFGPPAFPASQLIYPTPPDAILTHATPGMSSIDGIAMTPANVAKFGIEPSQIRGDHEMLDVEFTEAPRKTSGFYDEDLFDGIPGDSFTPQNDDDPDWDMFGQPEYAEKSEDDKSEGKDGQTRASAVATGLDNDTKVKNEHNVTTVIEQLNDGAEHPEEPGHASFSIVMPNAIEGTRLSMSEPNLFPRPPKPDAHHGDDNHFPEGRRSSIYEPLNRSTQPANYDQKYASDGQFWFDSRSKLTAPAKTTLKPGRWSSTSSTSSSSSSQTDQMSVDTEFQGSDEAAGLSPSKWTQYQEGAVSPNQQVNDTELRQALDQVQHLLEPLRTKFADVPRWEDFALIEYRDRQMLSSPLDANMTAQILVDQVTQTSFAYKHSLLDHIHTRVDKANGLHFDLTYLSQRLSSSNLTLFLQNIHAPASDRSMGKVTKLPERQISVKRAGKELCASASILYFWDTLGLQPSAELKNITAFCIHPSSKQIADSSLEFLERIGDVYKANNLGSHSTSQLAGISNNGLISWSETNSTMPNLSLSCQRLGTALATNSDLRDNIVVYMIHDETNHEGIGDICRAFQILFNSFIKTILHKQASVEIALQIIPLSFITSSTTLASPSLSEYITLALEVYNRLPIPNKDANAAACNSAIILAKQNELITFELSTSPASPFTVDGAWLNLGYAVSYDKRWLVATWTDDRGLLGLSMTYCLRMPESTAIRPRTDVFKELWAISRDIMSKESSSWRLVVCRTGYYERTEIEDWIRVTKEDSSQATANCRLLLVSLEPDPMLDLTPRTQYMKPSTAGPIPPANQTISTPSSTPQTGVLSPDQLIPATPTPGGSTWATALTPPDAGFDSNNEADLTLTDPVEESWAVVLPYGASQSNNIFELRPAMASGYMVKKLGISDDDGVTAVAVHLVHFDETKSGRPARGYGEVLEEILQEFRGLVTLAASRGCIDRITEFLPWHVATSTKGAQLLSALL